MNTLRLRRNVAATVLASLLVFCGIVAGYAPAGAQTTAAHHHLNWVQRHPTMTAIGAGVATHHALKVMAARDKARGKRLNWAERHPTLSAVGVGVATHHIIKKHTPH